MSSDRMYTLPDDRNICENCGKPAVVNTDDNAHFCKKCAKQEVVHCVDCKCSMVYTVTIYRGSDNKLRCQICDQKHDLVTI